MDRKETGFLNASRSLYCLWPKGKASDIVEPKQEVESFCLVTISNGSKEEFSGQTHVLLKNLKDLNEELIVGNRRAGSTGPTTTYPSA